MSLRGFRHVACGEGFGAKSEQGYLIGDVVHKDMLSIPPYFRTEPTTLLGVLLSFFVLSSCTPQEKPDPISQLEKRFDSGKEGYYGIVLPNKLPRDASIETILKERFKEPIRDQGYITEYKILSDRKIRVPVPPDAQLPHAYLFSSNLGFQIAVVDYNAKSDYWFVRIYPGWWSSK